MKIYDLQWFTTFGMSYDEAAEALAADGIDTALTQNRIDPLPSSGVDQASYLRAFRDRLGEYDDAAWLDALRRRGLKVLETTALLFDPVALQRFPSARPVNALGEPDYGTDWYTGVCPTDDAYLDWKIGLLGHVARELRPDGLFLQFTRYPGFWENWTWHPDYVFTGADRYCFCDRCRALFAQSEHIELPAGPIAASAAILAHHREAWNRWRSARIVEIIARIRREAAGQRIMLNTLPFPPSDFGGDDVRTEFAAQDLAMLSPMVDRFELMTYLQILNRPISWIRTVVDAARAELPSQNEIVCTLQVNPLYLDGLHASRRRRPTVTADEIASAARTTLDAGVDGLVFYHWTDLLADEAEGGRKRQVVRTITHGR